MRGSHPGSFETAHSLRDGTFWESAGKPEDTGESYDLIVVGGGISGLAAAHFYRKATGNKARILILDNHDDFGGHAKRNEFRLQQRLPPGIRRDVLDRESRSLQCGRERRDRRVRHRRAFVFEVLPEKRLSFPRLAAKIFFDKETFGADKLVTNFSPRNGGESEDSSPESPKLLKQFLSDAPMAEQAKRDLQNLYDDPKDYYPGLTSDEKKAKLARISYAKYLTDVAGVHEDIVKLYQALPHGLFGVGIDAVAAQDAWGLGLPGFGGFAKLIPAGEGNESRRHPQRGGGEVFFPHFPDGNASIARLLVRQLIPQSDSGHSEF